MSAILPTQTARDAKGGQPKNNESRVRTEIEWHESSKEKSCSTLNCLRSAAVTAFLPLSFSIAYSHVKEFMITAMIRLVTTNVVSMMYVIKYNPAPKLPQSLPMVHFGDSTSRSLSSATHSPKVTTDTATKHRFSLDQRLLVTIMGNRL